MEPAPIQILVVEDSVDDYDILGLRLAQMGLAARLQRVEDEPGMRAALESTPWDVVVCDHKLPRFSFQAALRMLRARDPDTPLIVVSGAIGEEAAVDAMLGGADDFIVKGNLARLPAAIRRSIESAESRRHRRRAEHALRESEGMLRSLSDNLPAVMLSLSYDRATRAIGLSYVGGAASQLLNTRAQALLEVPEHFVNALAPEERQGLLAQLQEAAERGGNLSWQGRTASARGGRWLQLQGRLRRHDAKSALWDAVAFDVSDLKHAEGEVRELTAHLERVKETERAGVAREIHDDIGAIFFGLKLDLAWLRKRITDTALLERLDGVDAQLESGIQASQRIVHLLRPPILDYGVVAAIEWLARDFAKRTGMACKFKANVEELSLAQEYGTAVFRVMQESLTNILRHAAATEVRVRFEAGEGGLRLTVKDNGRGIEPAALRKRTSFGLRGMRERALELGGSFELGAAEGGGTRLVLSLPVRAADAEEA